LAVLGGRYEICGVPSFSTVLIRSHLFSVCFPLHLCKSLQTRLTEKGPKEESGNEADEQS
jgi:hypothetical protein